ncbi:MAG TPA: glycosyltransferase [Acidimicrobiales bacterium]|nr:glycosyltransferase [Acidimicrobiales bacterium]
MSRAAPEGGRVRRIDQLVPSYVMHDAISNHVGQVQRALRAAGYESEIFYEHLDPRLEGRARSFLECDPRPDPQRMLLYQASTSSAMAGWLLDAVAGGQDFVINYHNITPSEFFARWEPLAARSMQAARRELAELAPHAVAALAVSAYNAAELTELGCARTAVCPLLVDLADYHRPPDPATSDRLRARRADGPLWLFVGRIAPNKCQHDVIAAFAVYRRLYAPGARLALIGGATSGRYQASLQQMVGQLGLDGSVEFLGSAPFPDLLAYFGAADAFVCLSEHEGFCVPVIEAMELGVPVVAYRAAAIPDTVGDAGLLLDDKDPLRVATAVHELLGDGDRREALVAAGRKRAADLALPVISERFVTELQGLMAGPATTAAGHITTR